MRPDGAPIASLLRAASQMLAARSDSARADAELLLSHVLGLSRSTLPLRGDDVVPPADGVRFDDLVRRRAEGEPVAYLTGRRGFWTLDLDVTPDVLVPRPETELLVEWMLELANPRDRRWRIADLGTGSGAIALALATELKHAEVTAVDRSVAALEIARLNAGRCAPGRVTFVESDWYASLPQGATFDLLVSNPPYVAEGDPHLADLRHEPAPALASGTDGLDALRAVVGGASARLVGGGWLCVEHGAEQGGAVRALFEAAGFASIATRRDLAGLERATGGRKP